MFKYWWMVGGCGQKEVREAVNLKKEVYGLAGPEDSGNGRQVLGDRKDCSFGGLSRKNSGVLHGGLGQYLWNGRQDGVL